MQQARIRTRYGVRSRSFSPDPKLQGSLKWLFGCYDRLERMHSVHKHGGAVVIEAVRDSLCSFASMPEHNKVWRVIRTDGSFEPEGFKKRFVTTGIRVGACADDLLRKPACVLPTKEIKLILCVRSVEKMGFEFGASYGRICDRLCSLGFELCPEWLALILREQYKRQPKEERLHVAMCPVIDSTGRSSIFTLVRDADGLHLCRNKGAQDALYGPQALFV